MVPISAHGGGQQANAGNQLAQVIVPLGTDIDAVFKSEQRILLPGQSLFIYNDGLRQLSPLERLDIEDEGLCETLSLLGGSDLGTLNEWVEGRFANRSISSHREPADAAFTLLKRMNQ